MTRATRTPAITAVVPCRDERASIQACIESLLSQQEPPGGFEIVVVDGMSRDGTREILARLAASSTRLRLIDNPRQTTAVAFNAGIRTARGRYVAILGSHNRYAEDYLKAALAVLEETGADNVGGAMLSDASGRVQRAIAAAFHHPFSAGGARWHNPAYEGPTDTVFGGVYRREIFEQVGYFDEELVRNQDDEWNLRLVRSGGTVWQSPRIRSWYRPRASLRQLFSQYRQYGYWKVRVIQKHRLPASPRHLAPGALVAFVILAGLATILGFGLGHLAESPAATAGGRMAGLALGAVLAAYLGLMAIAVLQTARRWGLDLLPILPWVFAAYHLGYGVGFLEGIGDFVLLGRGPRLAHQVMTR